MRNGYTATFSSERLRVVPDVLLVGKTGKLMDGDQLLANVSVSWFDRNDKPVLVSFKRVSDNDPNQLSGHVDSIIMGVGEEIEISFPGWFSGLMAVASSVESN